MKKIRLFLPSVDGGAFNCRPAQTVELDRWAILANDPVMPWDTNPHRVRLYATGHEFGAMAAAWGGCPQDALDEIADFGLLDGFEVTEPYHADDEDIEHLGNFGKPYRLGHHWWIREVEFFRDGISAEDAEHAAEVLWMFQTAMDDGEKTLDDI